MIVAAITGAVKIKQVSINTDYCSIKNCRAATAVFN